MERRRGESKSMEYGSPRLCRLAQPRCCHVADRELFGTSPGSSAQQSRSTSPSRFKGPAHTVNPNPYESHYSLVHERDDRVTSPLSRHEILSPRAAPPHPPCPLNLIPTPSLMQMKRAFCSHTPITPTHSLANHPLTPPLIHTQPPPASSTLTGTSSNHVIVQSSHLIIATHLI